MHKAIGFLGGQYGDAIITLGIQKAFTDDNPKTKFTFALSDKYRAILPLFKNEKHIDRLHVWEGYDDTWPTDTDQAFIEEEKFDQVFHPMQRQDPEFFLKCHQVTSVCRMYGYRDPDSNKVSLVNPWGDYMDRVVGMSVFPNDGQGLKALNVARANAICAYIKSKGFSVLQFGGSTEPLIEGAIKLQDTYVKAAQSLSSCRFLVTGDTGFSWLASAYDVPVVGLYARGYYPQAPNCKNWQPVNDAATYLENWTANDIELESIFRAIDKKIHETRPRTNFV